MIHRVPVIIEMRKAGKTWAEIGTRFDRHPSSLQTAFAKWHAANGSAA